MHAVWAVAQIPHRTRVEHLLRVAVSDQTSAVRVQAVRALADELDPNLAHLDAGLGSAEIVPHLTALAKKADRPVLLEIVVALGRCRWTGTADWLLGNVKEFDPPLAHAAMHALRRSNNWPAILKLLDAPSSDPLRQIALRAAAVQFDPVLVDGLCQRLFGENDPARSREYADLLTRVYRQPGPWVYWNYRPGPRPANTESWERTTQIGEFLDTALGNPDPAARVAILRRMQREQIPMSTATLGRWLQEERDPERASAILVSLAEQPAGLTRAYLLAAARAPKHSPANRQMALNSFLQGLNDASASQLIAAIEGLEEGPLLAAALRAAGRFPQTPVTPLLLKNLNAAQPEVRAAAIEALSERGAPEARQPLLTLFTDEQPLVRAAAASAAGKLASPDAIDPLLRLAADPDSSVRRASLSSLRRMKEPRALPVAVKALGDPHTALAALDCLAELGGPEQAAAVAALAQQSPAVDLQAAAIRVLAAWRERPATTPTQRQELDQAIAAIQGSSGLLTHWLVAGPLPANLEHLDTYRDTAKWRTVAASGVDARVVLAAKDGPPNMMWLAVTGVFVSEPTELQFLGSSSGSLHVFLNDKQIYERKESRTFRADSDRFAATLANGDNRISVTVGSTKEPVEFHLRFRRKSATAEHERLAQAAITRTGNIERGRQVLANVEKSQCLKCHRVGDQGERTGPELTGLGSRFSRIHIAESILEPSRSIAPSFGTLSVLLTDGRPLSGVKIAETDAMLTLVDNQAQKHVISKVDIDQQKPSPLSTMPEGLEKRLSEDEFVDLVALLASLKEIAPLP
jgi:putative heme-binding domain-containing protein